MTFRVNGKVHYMTAFRDSARIFRIADIIGYIEQGRSKLFKSAGDGCSLFVNNKKDEFNDRRVQKV